MTTEISNKLKNDVSLVDVVDRLLEKGAVVKGDIAIRLADIDLVYVGLQLVVTSISKVEEMTGRNFSNKGTLVTNEDLEELERLSNVISKAEINIKKNVDGGKPRETEKSIAQLVLTVVELVRKIMEKEVVRRMNKGMLTDLEKEKLGLSLKAIDVKIKEIQSVFGINDDELKIMLGPLGSIN